MSDHLQHINKVATTIVLLIFSHINANLIFHFQNFTMIAVSDMDIWIIGYIIMLCLMSVISFCVIKADKAIAMRNGENRFFNPPFNERRYSECSLHIYELMGGFIGSFIAQHIYCHKIKKASYQITFWLIVAIHCGVIYLWYKSTDSLPSDDNNRNITTTL